MYASEKEAFVNGDFSYTASEVDKIKDSVLNTQLQLRIFKEILEKEGINQSYPEITIAFKNDLSERYKIFSVEYILNGVRTYYYQMPEASKRDVASKNKVQDFKTSLSPGPHTLQAVINFIGNDKGVFSYLSEYKVQVLNKKDVELERNKNYRVEVRTFEKGGLLADFKDKAKLSIAFQEVNQ